MSKQTVVEALKSHKVLGRKTLNILLKKKMIFFMNFEGVFY